MLPLYWCVGIGALWEAFHDASGKKNIYKKSAIPISFEIWGMKQYWF